VRSQGLDKVKKINLPHRVSKLRPSGLYHRAATALKTWLTFHTIIQPTSSGSKITPSFQQESKYEERSIQLSWLLKDNLLFVHMYIRFRKCAWEETCYKRQGIALIIQWQDNDIPTADSSRTGTCFCAELQQGISLQRVRVYDYWLRHSQAPLQLSLLKCVSHVYLRLL
jgi:hypothetical protein